MRTNGASSLNTLYGQVDLDAHQGTVRPLRLESLLDRQARVGPGQAAQCRASVGMAQQFVLVLLQHTEDAATPREQVSGGRRPGIAHLEGAMHPGALVMSHVGELGLYDIHWARDELLAPNDDVRHASSF